MGLYLPSSGLAQSQTAAAERQSCSALTQDTSPNVSVLPAPVEAVPSHAFEIIAYYPHDRNAFTEGLAFYRGELYESTGIRGRSSVRRLDLKSGRVLKMRSLEKGLFGEGLTVLDQQLVQLTWQSGLAFMYAPDDLRRTGRFNFSGEGWGSTSLDAQLVISDGSSRLRFFNTGEYRQTASLQVTERGRPVEGLNELETVAGFIYANVYPSDCIAQIDPQSGRVVGWIDLSGLMPLSERPHRSAVANGIAYNPETRELFVTGKLWPYIYQLRLLTTETLPDKQVVSPGNTGWRL